VGVCISKTIWFIDTNILAPWILEKGNILDLIRKKPRDLPGAFVSVKQSGLLIRTFWHPGF